MLGYLSEVRSFHFAPLREVDCHGTGFHFESVASSRVLCPSIAGVSHLGITLFFAIMLSLAMTAIEVRPGLRK